MKHFFKKTPQPFYVIVAVFIGMSLFATFYKQVKASTLSVPSQYPTIQSAVDSASEGDTILIQPGTYNEVVVLNKAVILEGASYDANNPENNTVVIDGGGAAEVVYVPYGLVNKPMIRGVVITNGDDGIASDSQFDIEYSYLTNAVDLIDYEQGSGGINRYNVYYGATDDAIDLDNPDNDYLIEHNRIYFSDDDGVEIRLNDTSAPLERIDIVFRDNEIIGNGAAGVQLIDYINDPQDTNRRAIFHNNLFVGNFAGIGIMPDERTAEDHSGGDMIEPIHVYNNTFYDNDHAISGGDNLVSFNNIFAKNNVGAWKVQGETGSDSVVDYSLFYQNTTDYAESTIGANIISGQDPLFVSEVVNGPDGIPYTLDDDYSGLVLQPGSPAVNYGVAQYTSLNGKQIPAVPLGFTGTAPDLGWKGSATPPSPSPSPSPSPVPTTDLTFPILEDATIVADRQNQNYGTLPTLEVDASAEKNFLMKFNVSGLEGRNVIDAKIHLYSVDASNIGGIFYSLFDHSWSETDVTWNTASASASLAGSLGPVVSDTWYEVSVSDITNEGLYSYRVSSTSSDGVDYASREDSSGFAPYLVVSVEDSTATPSASPTPTPTPTVTPTPTPIPSPSPTVIPSPTPTPTPTPSPSPTPTPPAVTTVTFTSTDDASIYREAPNTGFGLDNTLEVDQRDDKDVLLKFDVSGVTGTIQSAKIRLYNTNNSNFGGSFYTTTNLWNEATVTWNTAPQIQNFVGSFGMVSTDTWYEIDVTNFISGNGAVSFRVDSTSNNGADYSSNQGNFPPQLVVEYQ